MDPSHSSDSDSEELQLRVDIFRKLGYSATEVKAALKKLGLNTDTNSVLGELVRNRTNTSPSFSDSDEKLSVPKDSLLPSSWDLGSDSELRHIVIDGSNVAMSHGNKEVFSCWGIQLAVDFFLDRGHSDVTVFVPSWRKEQPRADAPLTDQHILLELEKRKILAFTPSRRVGGKRVVCYDDRFIIKLAYESDGVIVSNDTYRDLQGERPEWKKCIEERLLMFSFVNDKFMPPDDPLGRHGPNLDNFLRKKPLPVEQKKPLCPYDKKCTYGVKCKFYHPERANQSYLSLADELREKAQISAVKEERKPRLQCRQPQSDPEPPHNACVHPRDAHLPWERQSSSLPGQISENKLLYWDDFRKSPNHMPGGQSQKEYPGLHFMPNYYPNMSVEYMDSGFSSLDSPYSDMSQPLSSSHRHRPQHQNHGAQHAPVPPEDNTRQPCRCCSHQQQQHYENVDHKNQPIFDPYLHHMFPPSVPHQHRLPASQFHSSRTPHYQSYWSEPYQGQPQARATCSLPAVVQPPHSHSSCHSYENHPYQTWAQQQPAPSAAFDPQRSEVQTKLRAIFNPHQVDRVMEMFPQLMDPEKLAAEILKLKDQKFRMF